MTTRLFELSVSVPCKDIEAEEGMTKAVEEVARQLYAMAAMLAWRGTPRIRLTITSSTIGKVTTDVLGDAAAEAERRDRDHG